MAVDMARWFLGKFFGKPEEVDMRECFSASTEFRVRLLALNTCVSLIASAVGKCEFRTFRKNKEVREQEYWLWNVEPNINQNSTEFLHKLIANLVCDGKALVIGTRHRDGHEMLVVADSFKEGQKYPAKMNTYTEVKVGEVTYDKTFRESEVLCFRLRTGDHASLIGSLAKSYEEMIAASRDYYIRNSGAHLKVHVSQMESAEKDYASKFKQLMDEQVKPWLTQRNGVLPEFDGYKYEDMSKNPDSNVLGDVRKLCEDVFSFTARCLGIPPVLLTGDVAGTADAMTRWLTTCIDPLCDLLQEEINRKRYGYEAWASGSRVHIDTTAIVHFDLFSNAASVEKLIGSGCFCINDVLRAAGLPEIDAPWAREHRLTKNIGSVEASTQSVEHPGKGGNNT